MKRSHDYYFIAALLVLSVIPQFGLAQTAPAYLVRVPLPIVGSIDQKVRQNIQRAMGKAGALGEDRLTLVLEFWPESENAASSEFERSLALARFLVSPQVSNCRTVAYLPKSVTGHAVLPVLACEEIVMASSAKLGAAGVEETTLSPMMRGFYADIAERRRTVPTAVAIGMLDQDVKVVRATTPKGARYLLGNEVDELGAETNVQEIETITRSGELTFLSGNQLRLEHGFVAHLVDDRRELATILKVAAGSLEPNPSIGEGWKAIAVNLHGPITKNNTRRVRRVIEEQLRKNVNLVCIKLDSPGGSPEDSVWLANYLAALDSGRVRTVVFVEREALADAAIVAMGCDQVIAMSNAKIGGPGAYQPTAKETEDLRFPIRKMCEDKSNRWSLPVSLIDPEIVVYRYELRGADVSEYFSEEEFQTLGDRDRWQRREPVTEPDKPLQLLGRQAADVGFAQQSVNSFDEVIRIFDLEQSPSVVASGWADDLIEWLAQPAVAGTLLFFGGFALMVELSSPGVGAGAFISIVCFVVFFWANFLNGTADFLEILLFLTGVLFIVVEIFVLPGFGLYGIGGFLLVLASLILASQTFIIPQNEYQYDQLPRSLATVVGAGVGVMFGLMLLSKYLGKLPFFNRLLLEPPGEDIAERELIVRYDDLLGQEGVAATKLVPAGKATIDERLIDVVSSGLVVDKGAAVRVVQVNGNRVVVEEA